MDSDLTITASDSCEDETTSLDASLHITSSDRKSEVPIVPSSPYDLETGFEEESSSQKSSTSSEYEDDSFDDDVLLQSVRKYRGKSLKWVDHLDNIDSDFVMYNDLDEVISDATKMNYSKTSSSSIDVHIYKCKHRGCSYKRKYCRIASDSYYVSYSNGNHEHNSLTTKDDHRGLTGTQKLVVQEAFENKRKSAREIINFFRSKRKSLKDNSSLSDFPEDPNTVKLNNYIQSFKKKNNKLYNPTPSDLKSWCDSHSSSTVDLNNHETYNTPFVLDYMMVSILKFVPIITC